MERWNKYYDFVSATDLKDLIGLSDEEIINRVVVLYVDYNSIKNNFDLFLRVIDLMSLSDFNVVNVDSFKTLKFINDNLKEKKDIFVHILDDYQMIDRSNIKPEVIDKVKFSLPFPYLMWGIDFDNFVYVSNTSYQHNAMTYNGNESMSLDTLKRIRDIISYLKSLGKFNDLQIIILVANYLQKNVEYLTGNHDEDNQMIYKLDKFIPNIEDEVGLVETVLFKKFGLCTGISNATTILLNNPEFRIDTRTIFNEEHALNIVKYNGEYYFLDNTWGITRSKREMTKAIKPLEFNPNYILYGKKQFINMVKQEYVCDNPNILKVKDKGIRREDIIKAQRGMMDRVSFTYDSEIIHPLSKIRKKL